MRVIEEVNEEVLQEKLCEILQALNVLTTTNLGLSLPPPPPSFSPPPPPPLVSEAVHAVNAATDSEQLQQTLLNELIGLDNVDPAVSPHYLTLLQSAKEAKAKVQMRMMSI